MWTSGLREMRPIIFAVGSPRRLAIQAWADSWTLIANSKTTISKKMVTGSRNIIELELRYYHAGEGTKGRGEPGLKPFCLEDLIHHAKAWCFHRGAKTG